MTPVRTVARAMLGAIFVVTGAESLRHPEQFEARTQPLIDRAAPLLERAGLHPPTEARSVVRATGAVQIVGAVLMLTPLRRPAAIVLAASLMSTTLTEHALRHVDDPDERHSHRIHLLKDVGLMGGLLLAALDNGGRPSLRWRAAHVRREAEKSVLRTAANTRSKANIAMKSAAIGRRLHVKSRCEPTGN